MAEFGEQGYFLNFPSKFLAGDTGWLWYSANFLPLDRYSNPAGSGYHLCAREVAFQRPVRAYATTGPAAGGGVGGRDHANGNNALNDACTGVIGLRTGAWALSAILALAGAALLTLAARRGDGRT
jgi:hypothetical protein